jgi:hypothetical protein
VCFILDYYKIILYLLKTVGEATVKPITMWGQTPLSFLEKRRMTLLLPISPIVFLIQDFTLKSTRTKSVQIVSMKVIVLIPEDL